MRLVATRHRCLLASAAIVVFALAVELARVISSDIGFLLYAAGRLLDGARLYVDLIEINPPLIVALNVPVVLAARALGLPEVLVYRLAVAALLLACIGLTARALSRLSPAGEARSRWVLLLLTLALFLPPGADFGQREHLMLALITPYLVLAAARSANQPAPRWEAAGIGALAGLGFALKPHFLLLLVGIEGYLMARRRKLAGLARPESLGAMAVLATYGALVLLLTPDYVKMVRLLGGAYLRFLYDPFLHLLVTGRGVLLSWFAVLAWAALSKHLRFRTLGEVLVVGVFGSLLAAAAQQKGLPYHFYPSLGLALVLLGVLVADAWGSVRGAAERLYQVLAAAVLAMAVIGALVEGGLHLAGRARPGGEPELVALSRLVREKAAGQPIFIMSHHIGSAFPLINYSGAVLGSRFHHLWILAGDYLDRMKSPEPLRYRAPEAMPASERFLNQAVLADLERYRPRLLIVLRHARDHPGSGYRRFDYIRYFGRDPRFARILHHYQELETVGNYVVYERVHASEPRTRPPPVVTPGTLDLRRRRGDVLGLGLLRLVILVLAVAALTAVQLAGRSRGQGSESPRTGGT
ncbi:MAG TPA: hypothetical protein VF061_06240 [Gemmatimonadales bacterium]